MAALDEVRSQESRNFISVLNRFDSRQLGRAQLRVVQEAGADLVLRLGQDRGIACVQLVWLQRQMQYRKNGRPYLGRQYAQRA